MYKCLESYKEHSLFMRTFYIRRFTCFWLNMLSKHYCDLYHAMLYLTALIAAVNNDYSIISNSHLNHSSTQVDSLGLFSNLFSSLGIQFIIHTDVISFFKSTSISRVRNCPFSKFQLHFFNLEGTVNPENPTLISTALFQCCFLP